MAQLQGIIPALITPLTEDGMVNFVLLEQQVRFLSSAGVDGFLVNGTTGEGPCLSLQERLECLRVVKQVAEGRQFLCAACLQPSTAQILEELQLLEPFSLDFIVAGTPFYFQVSQKVIIQHYQEIARNAPAPVILYNIPARTQNPLSLETIFELAYMDNIVGLKDSSGDFITFSRGVYAPMHRQFTWIQGRDALAGPSLLIGAQGIVTGLGNVWIDPFIAMYHAFKNGDVSGVHQAQQQINGLREIIQTTGGKIIPAIKAGAMLLGRSTQWMKISGLALCKQEIVHVKEVLVKLGLLQTAPLIDI